MAFDENFIARIIEKVKEGEKISRLAREAGLTEGRYAGLYKALRARGVKLKRGPKIVSIKKGGSPEAYQQHFDEKYWPGAAREFLEAAPSHTLQELAEKFGRGSREWARQIYYNLSGGMKKLRRPQSPSITPEKLRKFAQTSGSIQEMADGLKVNPGTIRRWAARYGIELPKHIPKLKRPDITPEKIQSLALVSSSIKMISRELKTSYQTILRRSRRYDIVLPNQRSLKKPR